MTERGNYYTCRGAPAGEPACPFTVARDAAFAVEQLRDHAWSAHRACWRCWRRHDPVRPCPAPRPVSA